MTNKFRVLILGAGYSGLVTAARLANRLRSEDVEVVLVTAEFEFVERPRLHQVAAGQEVSRLSLEDLLRRTSVVVRYGVVTTIRPDADEVVLDGGSVLGYDRLVVGLGSQIDVDRVPGAAEYALALTDRRAAEDALGRIVALPQDAIVSVCGGGLTGIEIAAEIAETRSDVGVRLVSRSEPGAGLAMPARKYLDAAFDQLGVARVTAAVARVDHDRLILDTSEVQRFDVCLWAGGFRPSPLVAESGLLVDAAGRAVTDRSLRSVSHPRVRVVGDAAAVPGQWGDALAMGCRTGGFTGPAAADALAAELTGKPEPQLRFRYLHECISLGRRRGLVQFLDAGGSPTRRVLTGRMAITYKNATLNGARLLFRHPGPYLRGPRRALARRLQDAS